MKHSFLPAWIGALALLAGCSHTRDPALDRPEIGVVRIRSTAADGSPGVEARGFFVSANGLIVTTRHAISGGPVFVTPDAGPWLRGEIVQEDEGADVAIIKVRGTGFAPLHLNAADIEPGLHVRVVGAKGPAMGTFNQWDDFGRLMEITAPVDPADAGSPVLADDGSVVGVLRGPTPTEPSGRRVTPAWRILRLMPMLASERDR